MTEPKAGQSFDDRYELLEVLGSGGFGTVYKSRQIDIGRLLALKIFHREFAEDKNLVARFMREAHSLSKLEHMNVVTIYHAALSQTGLPYLAMELIEGRSLRSMINSHDRMPTVQALQIIMNVAAALSHVHQRGIIHRDLKPENIILVDEPEPNTVKLIDFGLARLENEKAQKLTQTGELIGTAFYMSPEQCTGHATDARSDIYSLTVCLYELVTGIKPFNSDTSMSVMYKHMNEDVPSVRQENKKHNFQLLDAVISRGMAKDPAKRFQSMDQLCDAIAGAIDEIESDRPYKSKSTRIYAILGALILLLVAGVAALKFFKSQNEAISKSAIFASTVSTIGGGSEKDISSSRKDISSSVVLRNLHRAETLCDEIESAAGLILTPLTEISAGEFERALMSTIFCLKAADQSDVQVQKRELGLLKRLTKLATKIRTDNYRSLCTELHTLAISPRIKSKELIGAIDILAAQLQLHRKDYFEATDNLVSASIIYSQGGYLEESKQAMAMAEALLAEDPASRGTREFYLSWAKAKSLLDQGNNKLALETAQKATHKWKQLMPERTRSRITNLRRMGELLKLLGDKKDAEECLNSVEGEPDSIEYDALNPKLFNK